MPSPAAGAASAASVQPEYAGATRSISAQIPSRDSKPRSAPRRSASSVAITQSARATPGGTTLAARRVTRPSRFVVVPPRSAYPAAGSTTSASIDEALSDGVDRDEELDALERPGGEVAGRGSPTAGRRRAARACSAPPTPPPRDPGGVEARALGHRAPVARRTTHGRSRERPARAAARERTRGRSRRARSPAAAPEGSGPAATTPANTAAAAAICAAGSASDGRRARRRRRRRRLARRRRAHGRARTTPPGRVADARWPPRSRPRRDRRAVDDPQAAPPRPPAAAAGTGRAAPRAGRRRARSRCWPRRVSSIVARGRPATSSAGQPVAELGVELVGADDAFCELHPGIGVLVRQPASRRSRRPPLAPAPRQRSWRVLAATSPSASCQLVGDELLGAAHERL